MQKYIQVYKVIIAGGRDFNNYELLNEKVNEVLAVKKADFQIEIVSGTAKGADSLGEHYARHNNYLIKRFFPDWSIGKSAGYIRNKEMAQYAEACICFWDGSSKGTKQMIDLATAYQLALAVFKY